jgi:hypothetical protein
MFETIKLKIDELRNDLRGEQGIARFASRQLRRDIGLHEKENQMGAAYSAAVKDARADDAEHLLKGLLVIYKDDLGKIMLAFRQLIVFDARILRDIRYLLNDVDRSALTPEEKQNFITILNVAVSKVEALMKNTIGALAGTDSGSVAFIRMLEKESQERVVIQGLIKVGMDAKEWQKHVAALRRSIKQIDELSLRQKNLDEMHRIESVVLTKEHNPLLESLDHLISDVEQSTSNLTQLLSELHQELLNAFHSTYYKGKNFSDISYEPDRPLSVDVLLLPVEQGGFGFPENYGELVKREMEEVLRVYKHSLHETVEKARLILSEADHAEHAAEA